ncbi:MAG TPA: DHA2 family efflux MFS transporter permease subunit [Candidatus Dormibacteraeota bacterium]|nr:DHA2 family efflux MFS transporter permease subunit [Candidatus Dormibacteraeota bacterium]
MRRLRSNPWVVLVALCLGFFMILLDTTIVNIAIPSIIDGLHASLDQVLWVLNTYILVYAVLLITASRLGDLFGPKNLFLLGMAVFVVASAACGQARTPIELIGARTVQGIGGALLTPQTLAILTTIFPPERRGAAFGIWGAIAGVAAVAGPTLGGFLVTTLGWPWIFYVNVPIGILAFTLGTLVIPNHRPGRRHGLDLPGVLLSTAGLLGITFGLIEGQRYDWGQVWTFLSIPLILAVGMALLLLFFGVQALEQGGEPLLPFALLRERNFSLMNLVGAALNFGMLGLFLPIVIFFQSVLRLSALETGLTMAPMSVVSMCTAPLSGRLADRIGGKYILLTGLTLFAVGMGFVTWSVSPSAGRWTFLPGLLIAGLGMGCTFAPLATVAMRNIEPRLAGAASGVFNTSRQIGGVIGGAAVGAVLQNRLASALHDEAVARATQLAPAARQPFVAAFSGIAKHGLDVGAGQTGGSLRLPPGTPPALAHQLQQAALAVFQHAYVDAMRPTMVVPVGVLALAAVACLFISRRRRPVSTPRPAPSIAAGQRSS